MYLSGKGNEMTVTKEGKLGTYESLNRRRNRKNGRRP